MSCKYQNHPFPPCRFEQHPHNSNIFFCPHCRESYDVREVGNQSSVWLLFIIALIILTLVANSKNFQPSQDNPSIANPAQIN